jgi:acetyl esterase/lipase
MTDAAARSNEQTQTSTLVADLPRRASRRLRIAHGLSSVTLRKFIDLSVWVSKRGLLTPAQMLAVAGRADVLAAPLRPPRGTRLRQNMLSDFRTEWVWHRGIADPADVQDAAIVYFHGGALVAGGLNSHRRLVAQIGRACGAPVLNVEYRQIPQVHVTETVDDCVTAYRYLLERGFAAERIIVAGDSAGGGLAFALALAARDRGLPLPCAIVAIAPWANYDASLKRAHPNNHRDAILSAEFCEMVTGWGMTVDGQLEPRWSPVNHDFAGMPPALIQVSATEMLLADATELAQCYARADRPLTLQIWDNAVHVFHAAADVIPDAREAIADIGEFVRDELSKTDGS